MIGIGLAEPDTFGTCVCRVKDYDMQRLWEDILNFVFLKSFSAPSYFLYDSRFKGRVELDRTACYYIHDYYPSHCGRVHIERERARHSVYAFKDGEKPLLWAKIFSLCLEQLPDFQEIRENAVLIPIPASTRARNVQRYARFCRILSNILKIEDGFRAIWIAQDREQMKGRTRGDKLENVEFNAKYIRGKDVILCDDVTTTGQSLIQMKRKMMELGAKSVMGVFMARTVEK
ncbi:ComF family protein [Bacteroides clarus]|uniref:ComF family protein n=1 Tax=Bacteroides clarus TaxID=626929 RepID=UPI0024B1AEBE|nr:ribonucleotide-diphosphate reductase subunit beta [Bacteroides clarus]